MENIFFSLKFIMNVDLIYVARQTQTTRNFSETANIISMILIMEFLLENLALLLTNILHLNENNLYLEMNLKIFKYC